jgi:hypothetical protein
MDFNRPIIALEQIDTGEFEVVMDTPGMEFRNLIVAHLQGTYFEKHRRKWVPGQSWYKAYFQTEADTKAFQKWVQHEYFLYKLTHGV